MRNEKVDEPLRWKIECGNLMLLAERKVDGAGRKVGGFVKLDDVGKVVDAFWKMGEAGWMDKAGEAVMVGVAGLVGEAGRKDRAGWSEGRGCERMWLTGCGGGRARCTHGEGGMGRAGGVSVEGDLVGDTLGTGGGRHWVGWLAGVC